MRIDLRRLRQQGTFRDGALINGWRLHWSLPGGGMATVKISYEAGESPYWFRLEYSTNSQGVVDEKFTLQPFPQPFGGRRWYFICPSTGRRVQCLYCPPGATRFRARQAFRSSIRYLTQGYDKRARYQHRSAKLKEQMLRAGPQAWRDEHEDWEFPPKPPGMRWRTYTRKFELWEDYEAGADALLAKWVLAFGGMT